MLGGVSAVWFFCLGFFFLPFFLFVGFTHSAINKQTVGDYKLYFQIPEALYLRYLTENTKLTAVKLCDSYLINVNTKFHLDHLCHDLINCLEGFLNNFT